jgi:hypothetical protein
MTTAARKTRVSIPPSRRKKEVDKLLPAIYTIKADSSSQHGVL